MLLPKGAPERIPGTRVGGSDRPGAVGASGEESLWSLGP